MTSSPPPFAALIWHDARNVYLQCPGNPPAIQRFALTEGGLAKALRSIRSLPEQDDSKVILNWNGHKVDKPVPEVKRPRALAPKMSEEQMASVTDILRKLRMI